MSNNINSIGKIVNKIIEERSKGNPAIAEMTKAKLILKGIYPDRYDTESINDHPDIIEKLIEINQQWNAEEPKVGDKVFMPVFSQKATEEEIVLDIQSQLDLMGVKVLIYFASSSFDQKRLSYLMEKAFKDSVVFGCSTAGERINEKMLSGSVVALALSHYIIADAKIELIQNLSNESIIDKNIKSAFTSFDNYFQENTINMDTSKYIGMVFIDAMSAKEEKIIDGIGNLTDVSFVGASAADDLKFEKTYVYANGKSYSDAAIVILMKMHEGSKVNVIKTQSFNVREERLIANKVNVDTREVIEFNNKPAAQVYAEAIGNCSVEDLSNKFFSHPVGLVINNNNVLVRSPQKTIGSSIKFCCNILENMEVSLLENSNIVKETKKTIDDKINESNGKIVGLLIFDCIYRRIELESKNLVAEYGKIFKNVPTVGFYSYGETYIGHLNQTATMLAFEFDSMKFNIAQNKKSICSESTSLSKRNKDLEQENKELREKLEITTAELKKFNISLADEINRRMKKEERIAYLSYHDVLTGLFNYRYYVENIKLLDTEANLPISIIFGDVNGLKQINDSLGHSKGDELIKKAADAISSSCRDNDIAIRFGGDEFIILLLKTSNEVATTIAKRIIENASMQLICDNPISISFGIDTKVDIKQDIDETLKNAEDEMYINKNKYNKQ